MPVYHRTLTPFTSQQVQRFWNKVLIQPSGCWEWQGQLSYPNKYGGWKATAKHPRFYAHRIAYYLYNLADPAEQCVCHSCDNRACVNPLHLFLGSQQDNVTDMHDKGRYARGKMVPQCKLDDLAIADIRANYRPRKPNVSMYGFARKYGVAPATIYRIIHHISWKHI